MLLSHGERAALRSLASDGVYLGDPSVSLPSLVRRGLCRVEFRFRGEVAVLSASGVRARWGLGTAGLHVTLTLAGLDAAASLDVLA